MSDGRSFNADDLHLAQLAKLRERMITEQPAMLARGRQVLLDHLRAERDLASLKRDLFAHFGGEGQKDGIAMLINEASALLKAEEDQAVLDTERKAVDAAVAKRAQADLESAAQRAAFDASKSKQSAPQARR